jgi:hypothetical protein
VPPSPALISPPRVSAPVLRSNAVMPVAGHVYSPMPGLRVWRLPFKATGLGRKVDAPPPPARAGEFATGGRFKSPPLAAGTEPLGEAEPSLTNNFIW